MSHLDDVLIVSQEFDDVGDGTTVVQHELI